MKLKINKIDLIILIMMLVLIMSSAIVSNYLSSLNKNKDLIVEITISGKLTHVYDLKTDRLIVLKKSQYPVLLADMEIEIKDEKVRVKKESSPLNYCSKQGWVNKTERPIICLPNQVLIVIKGETKYDWVMPT